MLTDASTRARIGQVADLSDNQQYADVTAREQALIRGHADMAYSGFITGHCREPVGTQLRSRPD